MSNFMKKLKIATAFLLVTSMGHAYEDCNNTNVCVERDVCCPCEPVCCDNGRGFFSADLLYWRAFVSGIDDCFPVLETDQVTADGRVISRFNGRGRNPDFEWSPGVRLGTGYEFACSWGVGVFWTHLHSKANGSKNDFESSDSSSSSIIVENDVSFEGNRSRWNIDFDTIDVVASYRWDYGCSVSLRPFIGLRWARIDQSLRLGSHSNSISSSISSISSSVSSDFDPFSQHSKQDFKGLGPLFGVEADWSLGCGYSVYANASVAWIYGKSNSRITEINQTIDTVDFCEVSSRLDDTLTAFDAGVGVRWQTCFCSDMRLILQLGLEHHHYYNYSQIGECGDLSFDGLNFSAMIEF